MMKRTAIVALALLAGACATTASPTYQAATSASGSGYVNAPIGNDRQTIKYTGAAKMTPQQVSQYALLRAAEVTLQNGQEWFAILSANSSEVPQGNSQDLGTSAGPVMTAGNSGAGNGGADTSDLRPGVSDGSFQTGANIGGFGGGDVPYQVLERWNGKTVNQSVLIIQMGSGDNASFPGVTGTPTIMSAAKVREEILASMAE